MAVRPRRRRGAGDLRQLKVELWAAICEAGDLLADPETDPELKLKAISALATATGVYLKLSEASEFEARLTTLEQRAQLRRVV
jgi:hypothetical protein